MFASCGRSMKKQANYGEWKNAGKISKRSFESQIKKIPQASRWEFGRLFSF
jgi:hypothetical protein